MLGVSVVPRGMGGRRESNDNNGDCNDRLNDNGYDGHDDDSVNSNDDL